MKSGETAGQGNGPSTRRPHGKRSAQARIWKPGRRRQPSGARERWKPDRGETPQGVRCAARQRDRPSPRWPGTPSLQCKIRTNPRKASWICCECGLADPAQPGRRCSGAPSLRGGDSPQGFPLEASEARSAPQGREGITPSRQGADWIPTPASTVPTSPADSAHRARTDPKARWADRAR